MWTGELTWRWMELSARCSAARLCGACGGLPGGPSTGSQSVRVRSKGLAGGFGDAIVSGLGLPGERWGEGCPLSRSAGIEVDTSRLGAPEVRSSPVPFAWPLLLGSAFYTAVQHVSAECWSAASGVLQLPWTDRLVCQAGVQAQT